jgi:hypothetical protein
MKMEKTARTMIALLVLVGSTAVAANAQNNGRRLVATIPFQFNVGDKTLPPGEYSVAQVNPSSDRAVLQLRSKDGRGSAMIQMNNVIGKAPERAKLVFNQYGNQHYFAAAWIDGDAAGLQTQRSRSERATERELSALKGSRARIEVAAR